MIIRKETHGLCPLVFGRPALTHSSWRQSHPSALVSLSVTLLSPPGLALRQRNNQTVTKQKTDNYICMDVVIKYGIIIIKITRTLMS